MAMELCRIEISEPLEYITIGAKKPKKVYLNANVFYSGTHYRNIMKVVEDTKWFLHNHLQKVPKITTFPIEIIIYVHRDVRTTWDLTNKAYFWDKIICDKLVKDGKIPDDNINYISEIRWKYVKGPSKLVLVINSLPPDSIENQ